MHYRILILTIALALPSILASPDDVAVNANVKQCAASLKSVAKTTLEKLDQCVKVAAKCGAEPEHKALALKSVDCIDDANVRQQWTLKDDELVAKLTCPKDDAKLTSTRELMTRLCYSGHMLPRRIEGGYDRLWRDVVPKQEFVNAFDKVATKDESTPEGAETVGKVVKALSEAYASFPECKRVEILCPVEASSDGSRSKMAGVNCKVITGFKIDPKFWGTENIVQQTNPEISTFWIAEAFKRDNPSSRLSKIIDLMDDLNCIPEVMTKSTKIPILNDYPKRLSKAAKKLAIAANL